MPPAEEIVSGLTHIAHDALALAVLWHVAVAAAVVALLRGWRPSSRTFAASLSLPLVAVSALAWTHRNPFNGTVFAALAVALTALALRLPRDPVDRARGPFAALGWTLVAYAWCYPHFLADRSPLVYLVAAPVGLVPCPTLSLLLGLAMVASLPPSRAWTLTLAAAGLVYSAIGVARLRVWLDLGLMVGALALLARSVVARVGAPGLHADSPRAHS